MKHLLIVLSTITLLFFLGCTNIITGPCANLTGSAQDLCLSETGQCADIKQEAVQESCIASIAKQNKNLTLCAGLKSGQALGFCFEEVAIALNDSTICSQITNTYWHDNCYFQLNLNASSKNYCPKIFDIEQRETCFLTLALARKNYDYCEPLGPEKRASCLTAIAKDLHDNFGCTKIDDNLKQAACTEKVAIVANNKELCNTIRVGAIKEHCLEKINNSSN